MKDFLAALKRFGFEEVESSTAGNQYYLLGRLHDTPESLLAAVQCMKIASLVEDSGWALDFSKVFQLKKGKLVHGWRFIFDGDLSKAVPAATLCAMRTDIVHNDLPDGVIHKDLPGYRQAPGKGAAPMAKALVGKSAVDAFKSRGLL